jgi:hypothetical protein
MISILNQRKECCCFGPLQGALLLIYLEEEGDHCQAVFMLESFVLAPIRFLEMNQVHLHRKAETNSNDHRIKGKHKSATELKVGYVEGHMFLILFIILHSSSSS